MWSRVQYYIGTRRLEGGEADIFKPDRITWRRFVEKEYLLELVIPPLTGWVA